MSVSRHYILASFGTFGDVFPVLALGAALRRHGHQVTLASNETFATAARDQGIGFVQLTPPGAVAEMLSDPRLWHPWKSAIVGSRLAIRSLDYQYDVLSSLLARLQDHSCILACSPAVLAARIVSETRRIALATLYYTPWMLPSSRQPPAMAGGWSLPAGAPGWVGHGYWRAVDAAGQLLVGRTLNRLCRRVGHPPVRRLFQWWHSPQLAIGLFPEWYAPSQTDWPRPLELTGFPRFEAGVDSEGLTEEIRAFCRTGEPPVVFTFGSGMQHAERLFEIASAACRASGRRVLFLSRQRYQCFDDLPPSMRHISYVPLAQLLPHCAAIVHHGGIGTVAESLAAGVPQVIVPHAWDQEDNARRVERLGAGVKLSRSRFRPAELNENLKRVAEPRVLQAAHVSAERLRRDAGVDEAASLLEALPDS